MSEPLSLELQLDTGPGSDAQEAQELTQRFRRQLLELDVERAELVRRDDAPPGAKSPDAFAIGAVAVKVLPAAVRAVVGLITAWLSKDRSRSIEVTYKDKSIKVTNVSSGDIDRLLTDFLGEPGGQ